ncbi:hypothetical protein CDAR_562441 [Caerostris darwini]|uniref:Uncharacterized protein n=1 Tax=Caerostris darwini TaxID=1538125 RepID=A0AAV4X7U0_9ARAC|nr:hypothetical protein CDAR_562441 [Caerostris darwini]
MDIRLIRDSDASIDIVCYIYKTKNADPLKMFGCNSHWMCLQLTRVKLDCNLGHATVKVALIGNEFNQGRYLLGYRTASLFKRMKSETDSLPYRINAVTRAQRKRSRRKSKTGNQILRKCLQNSRNYVERIFNITSIESRR